MATVPPSPEGRVSAVPQRTTGRVVVVAGPDGSGKSYAAEHLLALARTRGLVLHIHHRPGTLPGGGRHDGPVTEPHRDPPYPPVLSTLKLLYVFLDHRLGWTTRIGPVRRAGGTVVIERGWWDLAVDPRRYRLRPHRLLVRALARLLPRAAPDRAALERPQLARGGRGRALRRPALGTTPFRAGAAPRRTRTSRLRAHRLMPRSPSLEARPRVARGTKPDALDRTTGTL